MGLKIEVQNKPKPGAVTGHIPDELAELLAQRVPEVMKDPTNQELIFTADTEKEAKIYAGYATAWGARQEPQIRIRRIPNRRDMTDTQVRMTCQLLSEATPLGRKPAGKSK